MQAQQTEKKGVTLGKNTWWQDLNSLKLEAPVMNALRGAITEYVHDGGGIGPLNCETVFDALVKAVPDITFDGQPIRFIFEAGRIHARNK